jgi:hypothetical protein
MSPKCCLYNAHLVLRLAVRPGAPILCQCTLITRKTRKKREPVILKPLVYPGPSLADRDLASSPRAPSMRRYSDGGTYIGDAIHTYVSQADRIASTESGVGCGGHGHGCCCGDSSATTTGGRGGPDGTGQIGEREPAPVVLLKLTGRKKCKRIDGKSLRGQWAAPRTATPTPTSCPAARVRLTLLAQ